VIITGGNAAVAVKQTTSVIPIVFVLAVDPVRMGLIASLARPGGNVTGLSNQQTDTPGKRLELLREVVPNLRRLAIMANVNFPEAVLEMREVQGISKTLGVGHSGGARARGRNSAAVCGPAFNDAPSYRAAEASIGREVQREVLMG
jgi:ABC transporter substrate binding protein